MRKKAKRLENTDSVITFYFLFPFPRPRLGHLSRTNCWEFYKNIRPIITICELKLSCGSFCQLVAAYSYLWYFHESITIIKELGVRFKFGNQGGLKLTLFETFAHYLLKTWFFRVPTFSIDEERGLAMKISKCFPLKTHFVSFKIYTP